MIDLLKKFKNKNVIITGHTGFKGSWLTLWLDSLGARVTGISNNIPTKPSNFFSTRLNKKINHLIIDVRNEKKLFQVINKIKPDYIFHLAAQSYPKTSFDSATNTYETNIIGTENVLKASLRFCPEATIHNCSSSEVFGRVPKNLVPIKENTPFHPASPYAISKCSADLIGRFYAEAHNMKVLTTRMFTHTGPRRGDVFMESTFAKQIALIEKGYLPPIVLTGNLDSVRTIADVRDAVKAYYLLVTSKDIPSGSVFNIGGKFTTSVRSILEKLISLSINKNILHQVDPLRIRPIDADLQIPDTSAFKKYIKWDPEYSFDQTMMDLLNYWRKLVDKNGNVYLQR